MGPFVVATVVPVAMFAALFATLYFFIQAREKERLKLIEKGYDLSKLRTPNAGGSQWLRYGITICAVALGVLIAEILGQWIAAFNNPVLLGILFGGLGMVLAWWVDRKVYPESERVVEPILPEFESDETDQ
ncbi:MAG: DUF6249 domain-containing protein [Balneolaceae bacterium]